MYGHGVAGMAPGTLEALMANMHSMHSYNPAASVDVQAQQHHQQQLLANAYAGMHPAAAVQLQQQQVRLPPLCMRVLLLIVIAFL